MAYVVSPSRGSQGMTLVELLVACALALLVLLVVVRTLVPSMTASRKAAARVDVHQRATLLGDRLAADLRLSTRAGLGVFTDNSIRDVVIHRRQPSHEVVWESSVRVYRWQDGQVSGRTFSLPNLPPGPQVVSPGQFQGREHQEFLRVKGVTDFSWVVAEGASVTFTIKVVEGDESQSLTRTVFLRNSSG